MKKKRGIVDVLLTLVLLVSLGVFCYAGFQLLTLYKEYKAGKDEYSEIAKMAVTTLEGSNVSEDGSNPETAKEGKEEKNRDLVDMEADEESEKDEPGKPGSAKKQPKVPIEVDFNALRTVNEDVIGWIYVEALSDIINYPVVHGRDNEEYLHMTYHRNYNFAGTIFIDYENHTDFQDCNTIIYGHNMKNGTMFGSLSQFVKKPETYKKSKYFWILTPTMNYRYEIISAYTTPVDGEAYTLFEEPSPLFVEYLKMMASRSELKTKPHEFTETDHLITLSTCTGDYSTRFIVQGVRVNEIPVKH